MHYRYIYNAWVGGYIERAEGVNLVFGVLINTIFNMGVSIFMLISGYYGMNHSFRKMISLELEVVFYSVIGMLISSIARDRWSIITIIRSFVPVITKKYWFITIYMLMMILGKYIDCIWKKLSQHELLKLIVLMFVVFSFLPTFTTVHVMEDGGKGLMNMMLMYLTGRYIKLYCDDWKPNQNKLLILISVMTGAWIATGMFETFGINQGMGIHTFLAGDSSVLTVFMGVLILIFAVRTPYYSKRVNEIASHVFAVYLLEGSIRMFLQSIFKYEYAQSDWHIPVITIMYSLTAFCLCIVIDTMRIKLLKGIERAICNILEKKIMYLIKRIDVQRVGKGIKRILE